MIIWYIEKKSTHELSEVWVKVENLITPSSHFLV